MIYLDNHATTPVDPRVLDAMLPYFVEEFGNASSSSHAYGWRADAAVEKARGQVATLIGADPREIVFTSGATESNNLALKGAIPDGSHVIASPLEHPSVTDTLIFLQTRQTRGCTVTWLEVDAGGRVDPADVERAIGDDTALVTLMAANNEIGTIQPMAEIGRICADRGVRFHSDVTQAVGKIAVHPRESGIHLAALTAHKIYGPKGAGALYVSRKDPAIKLRNQLHGGGQERGIRPGTLNVPGIVGLGAACELCRLELDEEAACMARLRDRLEKRLTTELHGVIVNGSHRVPGNLHVTFVGVDAQLLMLAVPDIAVSAGSACASGAIEQSHVLSAIHMRREHAGSSIRFGLGRFTSEDHIETTADLFVAAVRKLRGTPQRGRG